MRAGFWDKPIFVWPYVTIKGSVQIMIYHWKGKLVSFIISFHGQRQKLSSIEWRVVRKWDGPILALECNCFALFASINAQHTFTKMGIIFDSNNGLIWGRNQGFRQPAVLVVLITSTFEYTRPDLFWFFFTSFFYFFLNFLKYFLKVFLTFIRVFFVHFCMFF